MNMHIGIVQKKCIGMNMHIGTVEEKKCTAMNMHTGTVDKKCTDNFFSKPMYFKTSVSINLLICTMYSAYVP
jgi:hypothetical protein